jgi:hypothetical protein
LGIEHAQMQAVNAWANGEPFDTYSGNTVNQKMLTVCLIFLKALTSGSPADIAQAAREFRTRIEQQIGRLSEGRRKGGAGLYAFPAKAGGLADEARTTSHYHLHLAWLCAGLRAARASTLKVKGAGGAEAVLEVERLRGALLDWLRCELSWAHVCYVPGVGVLSPCRRHRRGKDHSLVLTSPDRNNLYRLLVLDGDDIDAKYRKQAARTQNEQQVGFRLIAQLLEANDPGLLDVARRIKADELAEVCFWDRLEVARNDQGSLFARATYERVGRDDTRQVLAYGTTEPFTVCIDEPRYIDYQPNEPKWTRTIFASSREEAAQ